MTSPSVRTRAQRSRAPRTALGLAWRELLNRAQRIPGLASGAIRARVGQGHRFTGEAAPFGRRGWDHVPISRAVQASAALSGLLPPVHIDGRHCVDGGLRAVMSQTFRSLIHSRLARGFKRQERTCPRTD